MERTSLITRLLVGFASDYDSLTLVNGLPDGASQNIYFTEAPLLLEGADYKEEVSESDQGQVITHILRAKIGRDQSFYEEHAHAEVMVYFETSNEELHFLGTNRFPLSYSYTRDSGAGNADSRDTQLQYVRTLAM